MPVFTSIGVAIFGAGTIGAAVTAYALSTAAGIGISYLASSLAGRPKRTAPQPPNTTIRAGGNLNRSILFGRCCTAGSIVYVNTWGEVDEVSNAYLTQVIALSDYPVQSLESVRLSGQKGALDLGDTETNKGYPVEEYRKDGKDHLWVKFYDGTQTSADSFLVNKVSSDDRPYSDERVGKGVAYAIVTSLIEEDLFSGGVPDIRFEIVGAKLYDPSKDTTVGGSGTQRWNNRSTWGGNGDHVPAVQIYNLLLGLTDYTNDEWLYGLQNTPVARLPAADWIAQINKCRANIEGPDGNEYTYRSGGEIDVSIPIADTIEGLLTACNGRLIEVGGVYKLRVGGTYSSVATFDDGDILSSEDQSFTPFYGLADTINGIAATYPAEAAGYNMVAARPLYRPEYEAQDGNRRLMADVSFDFVPYKGQVQRLMKAALREARRARRLTYTLPPRFGFLEPGDIVTMNSVRNGFETKDFRADGVVDKANLDVLVDLTEIDPTDYDWDQDADYDDDEVPTIINVKPAPQPIIDFYVEAASSNDNADDPKRAAIRLFWDPDQPDVRGVTWQVRNATTMEVIHKGSVDEEQTDAGSVLISQNILPATGYEVRARYLPKSNRETLWSDWLAVTTIAISEGTYDGIVGFDTLDEEVRDWQEWIGEGSRRLADQLYQNALITNDLETNRYTDFQTIRQQLSAIYETARATWMQDILVAAGPGSLVAGRLDRLEGAVPGLASFDIVDALTGRVKTVEGKTTASASSILSLNAMLMDEQTGLLATATATQALDARVEDTEDGISAQANYILSLASALGSSDSAVSGSANVNFRATTSAGPTGYGARVGIEAKATAYNVFRSASWYLDVPTDPDTPTRVAVKAGQFVVLGSGSTVLAVFDSATGKVTVGSLSAGVINAKNLFVDGEKVIATGSVETNAITNAAADDQSVDVVNGVSEGYETIVSTNLTPVEGKVIVNSFVHLQSADVSGLTARLRRGGAVVKTISGITLDDVPTTGVSLGYVDTDPGTTNRVWTLEIDVTSGSAVTATGGFIQVLNVKK